MKLKLWIILIILLQNYQFSHILEGIIGKPSNTTREQRTSLSIFLFLDICWLLLKILSQKFESLNTQPRNSIQPIILTMEEAKVNTQAIPTQQERPNPPAQANIRPIPIAPSGQREELAPRSRSRSRRRRPRLQQTEIERRARDRRRAIHQLFTKLAIDQGMVPEERFIEEIDQLPRRALQNRRKNGPICTICQRNFGRNRYLLKMKCGHQFHETCLRRWFVRDYRCPTCREYLPVYP